MAAVEAAEAAEVAAAEAAPRLTEPAPHVLAYATEIALLGEMGFDAEVAGRALVASGGDIEHAVASLSADA